MPGPYTYFNNIPQSTDQLSVSQPQLLTNFASLESYLEIDHVVFASPDAGQHNQVSIPLNSNSPAAPVFASGTIGLYNLIGATGQNELFLNKYESTGQQQVPMTASILSTNANPAAGAEWWTYLPSGLIMKGGGLAATGAAVVFPVAPTIPVFTQVLTLVTSVNAAPGQVGFITLHGIAPGGFNFTLSPGFPALATLQYLAIGY